MAEQLSSYLPPAPDLLANATLWGATGLLLTNFHAHLHLPYWACIALTNVVVRSSMIPVAVNGARTQVRLGSVSPEVQYLATSFTNDMSTLGRMARGGGGGGKGDQMYNRGRLLLVKTTMETMRGIYRMKDINPLAIFKVRGERLDIDDRLTNFFFFFR
jgi:membrane protein insertase Oxa1/YidC/SpoIIIJ